MLLWTGCGCFCGSEQQAALWGLCYLRQDGRSGLHPQGGTHGDVSSRLLSQRCPPSIARQVPPPQELPVPGALRGPLWPSPEVPTGRHVVPPSQVLPHLMPPFALLIIALTPALPGLVDHGGCSSAGLFQGPLSWCNHWKIHNLSKN